MDICIGSTLHRWWSDKSDATLESPVHLALLLVELQVVQRKSATEEEDQLTKVFWITKKWLKEKGRKRRAILHQDNSMASFSSKTSLLSPKWWAHGVNPVAWGLSSKKYKLHSSFTHSGSYRRACYRSIHMASQYHHGKHNTSSTKNKTGTTKPVVWWKETTDEKGRIRPVTALHLNQVVDFRRRLSIRIPMTKSMVRNMHYATVRDHTTRLRTPRLAVWYKLHSA